MAGKRLAAAVHLSHPTTGERLILLPGDHAPPELAALITHPDAFQPDPEAEYDGDGAGEDDEDDDAAAKPARARKARTDTE
ncbi:hypothetical protein [Kitasatospora purpeofusca]|uniref:hypothetical protein n=1 Tax=Kitasatospora purpeofusca TaxID=67352 RepID=UPI00381D3017